MAVLVEVVAGQPVQQSGLGAGAGEHDGVPAAVVVVPPAVDDVVEHVAGGGRDVDPSVRDVRVVGGGGVAVAELVEGGVLPGFDLAAVEDEFAHVLGEGGDGGGEPSAGGDLGELVVVADEDHLRVG